MFRKAGWPNISWSGHGGLKSSAVHEDVEVLRQEAISSTPAVGPRNVSFAIFTQYLHIVLVEAWLAALTNPGSKGREYYSELSSVFECGHLCGNPSTYSVIGQQELCEDDIRKILATTLAKPKPKRKNPLGSSKTLYVRPKLSHQPETKYNSKKLTEAYDLETQVLV